MQQKVNCIQKMVIGINDPPPHPIKNSLKCHPSGIVFEKFGTIFI